MTLAACLLAVRWAVDQFNSETVLFRESERLDVGLWLRHLLRDRQPTPAAAAAVFCGMVILWSVSSSAAFATMPSDFAVFARHDAGPATGGGRSRRPADDDHVDQQPAANVALAAAALVGRPAASLALAVAVHPVVNWLQAAVQQLYPLGDEVKAALERSSHDHRRSPLWQLVLMVAIVPAICEELAFRGFILSGFRHMGHRWRAIVFSAVFFGMTHGVLQQSLIACFVGVVIGVLAVQTGSLAAGHALPPGPQLAWRCSLAASCRRLDRGCPPLERYVAIDARRHFLQLAGGRRRRAGGRPDPRLVPPASRLPSQPEEQLQEAIAARQRGERGRSRERVRR